MSNLLTAPSGMISQYFGNSGGATTRYYWVQAIYPDGRSAFVAFPTVVTPASLDSNNVVLLKWNEMPGAIGYDVVQTPTSAAPSGTATIGSAVGLTKGSHTDKGLALFSYTCVLPLTGIAATGYKAYAHFIYDFSVDGGAQGTIVPTNADTIPINAVVVGGIFIPTTAVGSTGSATVAIGTDNGSSATSLLAATAKATLSLNAIIRGVPLTGPTPFKMTAAGKPQLTIATADLNAGVIEGWVEYFVASA